MLMSFLVSVQSRQVVLIFKNSHSDCSAPSTSAAGIVPAKICFKFRLKLPKRARNWLRECHFHFKIQSNGQPEVGITNLGWKESSLTMHSFFSGTCFHETGSARSTRALAFRRPKPKRLLTMSPAPFLFHPGLLDRGSNSEVQTTMCCRSLHVRSGLRVQRQPGRRVRQSALAHSTRGL